MKKLQQRVDSLKPYVISFRFQDGASIVDAVFKDGWHVPQSEVILSQKGEAEDLNYHMFLFVAVHAWMMGSDIKEGIFIVPFLIGFFAVILTNLVKIYRFSKDNFRLS